MQPGMAGDSGCSRRPKAPDGEVHGAQEPPSHWHWKPAADVVPESNANVAVSDRTVPVGPSVMTVSGALTWKAR